MIAFKPVPLRSALGQAAPTMPRMPQDPASNPTPPSSWSAGWESTKKIWVPGMVLTVLTAAAYMGISSGRRETDEGEKTAHYFAGIGSAVLGIMYLWQHFTGDRSK